VYLSSPISRLLDARANLFDGFEYEGVVQCLLHKVFGRLFLDVLSSNSLVNSFKIVFSVGLMLPVDEAALVEILLAWKMYLIIFSLLVNLTQENTVLSLFC
jgi:hypothetical protein